MIKNKKEITLISQASQIVAQTHAYLEKKITPGITTEQLNKWAEEYIKQKDAESAFLNYQGFPKSICTSINEEVVHGIPSQRKLKKGDIIAIDIGVRYQGYYGDGAKTYSVGEISNEKATLLIQTEKALTEAIKIIKEGVYVGEIGETIENYIQPYNFGIVEVLVGHGIGKKLHEKPDIPNYKTKHQGMQLKAGMVIAVEPMINLGTKEVEITDDHWTIVTKDKKPSAHFEHTILVLKDGCKILTKR